MNYSNETGFERYARQIRFAPLGMEGQKKLVQGRVLIVGAGALGSAVAETLARAGVGYLRVVDRDLLNLDNLHRQTLYTEADARQRLPKVEALANHIASINSEVVVEPMAIQADQSSISRLLEGTDVLVDCTDNFATRFLLNDAAIGNGKPLVHGGCLGCDGQVFVVIPGETACLRCLMPDGPPETEETCESAGVLMPIVSMVAALQSLECMKLLAGHIAAVSRNLTVFSLWDNRIRQINLDRLTQNGDHRCGVCKSGLVNAPPVLQGIPVTSAICGRPAVQVVIPGTRDISFENLVRLLPTGLTGQQSRFVFKFEVNNIRVSVFTDGRAVFDGTVDEALAETLYRQYVMPGLVVK